ncbi:hypothetical protein CWI75_14725 [Kineobactrum sediminis]|uniref:Uncharacterized protein n=1 Tax=Kineobactrum sediminis TaxID=1905677 RepID=A0A2N5XZZ2_9GAMM|nr:hypothetical protein [Kineobactrum sediminis]PLW81710.1 hypothetical protein CWI75_14725 [Kineobactrum sediminis]
MELHLIEPRVSSLNFTIEEATELFNCHVVRKEFLGKPPEIAKIGFVAGVITLNDEVEILIKFMESIEQIGKAEFQQKYAVIDT